MRQFNDWIIFNFQNKAVMLSLTYESIFITSLAPRYISVRAYYITCPFYLQKSHRWSLLTAKESKLFWFKSIFACSIYQLVPFLCFLEKRFLPFLIIIIDRPWNESIYYLLNFYVRNNNWVEYQLRVDRRQWSLPKRFFVIRSICKKNFKIKIFILWAIMCSLFNYLWLWVVHQYWSSRTRKII